jgi:hypothetical protein
LYTSNKVTLAHGFEPPSDAPASLDILRISVGTDPGLALGTRKGTGYYKVPSFKGVWYRGHYLHDGSAASLEEMFDPDRLKESHEPGGWLPVGAKTRAIQGHEFGLHLEPLGFNSPPAAAAHRTHLRIHALRNVPRMLVEHYRLQGGQTSAFSSAAWNSRPKGRDSKVRLKRGASCVA